MRRISRPTLFVLAVLATPLAARAQPTADTAGVEKVLRKHCLECHGAGPTGQSGLYILDDAQLRELIRPKDGEHSELVRLVRAGNMPPGRRPKLSDAEVKTLRDWVDAGGGPLRRTFDDAYVLRAILNDLGKEGASPAKWRYVSFAHLMNDPQARAQMDRRRAELDRAVNMLHWGKDLYKPVPVDDAQTVYRLDLSDLTWDRTPFPARNPDGLKEDERKFPERVSLYDLVLLEYPFGTAPDSTTKLGADVMTRYVGPSKMLRPWPYLRGDWFVDAVLRTPLYDDLLHLKGTVKALEKSLTVAEEPRVCGGLRESQVFRFPRLVERRSSRNRVYWRSYDFPADVNLPDVADMGMPRPIQPTSLVLFSLNNGLPAFYAADEWGCRVDGVDPRRLRPNVAAGGLLRPGASCLRCHADGPVQFDDVARDAISNSGLAKQHRDRLLKEYIGRDALIQKVQVDQGVFRQARQEEAALPRCRGPFDLREHEAGDEDERLLASFGHSRLRDTEREVHLERVLHDLPGVAGLPIDGLTSPDRIPPDAPAVTIEAVDAKTKQPRNVFVPKESYYIRVVNKSDRPVWIELVYTNQYGVKVVDENLRMRRLEKGQAATFPDQEAKKPAAFEVDEPYGFDSFTLYAADEAYTPGVLVELYPGVDADDVADAQRKAEIQHPEIRARYVHPFYRAEGRVVTNPPPARLLKRTIQVETRPGPK